MTVSHCGHSGTKADEVTQLSSTYHLGPQLELQLLPFPSRKGSEEHLPRYFYSVLPSSCINLVLSCLINPNSDKQPPLSARGTSLMARLVKNLPVMQENWVWFLDQEDPLEKGMAAYPRILAWEIPRTEEPGGLQSIGSHRVRHDWSNLAQWQKGSVSLIHQDIVV